VDWNQYYKVANANVEDVQVSRLESGIPQVKEQVQVQEQEQEKYKIIQES